MSAFKFDFDKGSIELNADSLQVKPNTIKLPKYNGFVFKYDNIKQEDYFPFNYNDALNTINSMPETGQWFNITNGSVIADTLYNNLSDSEKLKHLNKMDGTSRLINMNKAAEKANDDYNDKLLNKYGAYYINPINGEMEFVGSGNSKMDVQKKLDSYNQEYQDYENYIEYDGQSFKNEVDLNAYKRKITKDKALKEKEKRIESYGPAYETMYQYKRKHGDAKFTDKYIVKIEEDISELNLKLEMYEKSVDKEFVEKTFGNIDDLKQLKKDKEKQLKDARNILKIKITSQTNTKSNTHLVSNRNSFKIVPALATLDSQGNARWINSTYESVSIEDNYRTFDNYFKPSDRELFDETHNRVYIKSMDPSDIDEFVNLYQSKIGDKVFLRHFQSWLMDQYKFTDIANNETAIYEDFMNQLKQQKDPEFQQLREIHTKPITHIPGPQYATNVIGEGLNLLSFGLLSGMPGNLSENQNRIYKLKKRISDGVNEYIDIFNNEIDYRRMIFYADGTPITDEIRKPGGKQVNMARWIWEYDKKLTKDANKGFFNEILRYGYGRSDNFSEVTELFDDLLTSFENEYSFIGPGGVGVQAYQDKNNFRWWLAETYPIVYGVMQEFSDRGLGGKSHKYKSYFNMDTSLGTTNLVRPMSLYSDSMYQHQSMYDNHWVDQANNNFGFGNYSQKIITESPYYDKSKGLKKGHKAFLENTESPIDGLNAWEFYEPFLKEEYGRYKLTDYHEFIVLTNPSLAINLIKQSRNWNRRGKPSLGNRAAGRRTLLGQDKAGLLAKLLDEKYGFKSGGQPFKWEGTEFYADLDEWEYPKPLVNLNATSPSSYISKPNRDNKNQGYDKTLQDSTLDNVDDVFIK